MDYNSLDNKFSLNLVDMDTLDNKFSLNLVDMNLCGQQLCTAYTLDYNLAMDNKFSLNLVDMNTENNSVRPIRWTSAANTYNKSWNS